VRYHALRTRQAAARCFVSVHILVPGQWSVLDGHRLLERIEADIRSMLPNSVVFTHLEPLEDIASWRDEDLERSYETGSVAVEK
jgi:divalent metal cation (Fe/Co/Zn/Cd) transporter